MKISDKGIVHYSPLYFASDFFTLGELAVTQSGILVFGLVNKWSPDDFCDHRIIVEPSTADTQHVQVGESYDRVLKYTDEVYNDKFIDRYTVDVVAGTTYGIGAGNPLFDVFLYITLPDGIQLTADSSEDGDRALIRCSPNSDGVIKIGITTLEGEYYGSDYTFWVTISCWIAAHR